MNSQKNLAIRSQAFELSIEHKKDADSIQSAISTMQQTKLMPIIERVLSRFDPADSLLQFEGIELNLGVLKRADWQNHLPMVLEEQLTLFFQNNLDDQGRLKKGKRIQLKERKLGQLEFFLLHGYLRWEANASITPVALFKELLKKNKSGVKALLLAHAPNQVVRKRIITQLEEDVLEKIVEVQAGTDSSYLLQYKNNMLRRQQKDPIVERKFDVFRMVVWDVLLSYLLVVSNGFYNKKAYLSYLIKNVALRFNLTYALVLSVIAQGVQQVGKASANNEFEWIVSSLKAEEDKKNKNNLLDQNHSDQEDLLEAVRQYIATGKFKHRWSIISDADIKLLLSRLVKQKRIGVEYFISLDPQHPKRNQRLLHFFEETQLVQLIEQSSNPFFKEAWLLLETMFRPLDGSHGLYALKRNLSAYKGRFLMEWCLASRANLDSIFEGLEKSISISKVEYYQLLKQAKAEVPKQHKKRYKEYLKQTYFSSSAAPNKFIDSATAVQEIMQYLEQHNAEKWMHWLWDKIQQWSSVSGVATHVYLGWLKIELQTQNKRGPLTSACAELLIKINKNKLKGVVPTPIEPLLPKKLWGELEKQLQRLLSTELSRSCAENKFQLLLYQTLDRYKVDRQGALKELEWFLGQSSAFSRERSKEVMRFLNAKSEQSSKNLKREKLVRIIDFILEHQVLPWWHHAYQWSKFNDDIKSVAVDKWFAPYGLSLLAKEKIAKHIELPVLFRLWQISDQSKDNIVSKQAEQILEAIENQWIPAGWFPENSGETLQRLVFKLLKSGSSAEKGVRALGNWLLAQCATSKNKEIAEKMVLGIFDKNNLPFLPDVVQPAFLSVIKPKSLVQEHVVQNFSSWVEKNKISKGDLLSFMAVKNNRRKTIAALSLEQNFNQLNFLVPNNQIRFLKAIEALLGFFIQDAVSKEKVNALKMNILDQVYLVLGLGIISNWSLSHWSGLLSSELIKTLGLAQYQMRLATKSIQQNNKVMAAMLQQLERDTATHVGLQNQAPPAYKKLGEQEARQFLEAVYIRRAGLVLLHPFIGMLFEKCAIQLREGRIVPEDISRAVGLLEYAATGQEAPEEHELVLHKILCGVSENQPVSKYQLMPEDKNMVHSMLEAVIGRWSVLKNTSVEGLRGSFLLRNGKLEEEPEQYFLKVEQQAYDLLLDQLPWNITQVKLSWMTKMLWVEWR